MRLSKKLELGTMLFYCKFLSKRMPLFVSWAVTHKCNRSCAYCDISNLKTKELTTKQLINIIDQMHSMGNRMIFFTGGEPLLREDIGEIINHAKSKGIYTGITSNGDLVKKRIHDIKNTDLLQLSFDGPKEIHDMQRGKGSYDKVIEAIKVAKENNIDQLVLNVTLTKYNYEFIDFMLDTAKMYNIKLFFEPVYYMPLGSRNVSAFLVSQKIRKKVFNDLIQKKGRYKSISNTTASLKYFRDYPTKEKIKCGAFKITCLVTPTGNLYPCPFMENKVKPHNCVELGFKEAFMKSKPVNCDSCLCSLTLDVALFYENIFSSNPLVVLDMIKFGLK